jgi:hypothetical protein
MTEAESLHELSYELGRNAKGLEDLNKLFEQHCKDDDRRHEENVVLLKANNDAIEKLSSRVALMRRQPFKETGRSLGRRRHRWHGRGGLDDRGHRQVGGGLVHRHDPQGEARRIIELENGDSQFGPRSRFGALGPSFTLWTKAKP